MLLCAVPPPVFWLVAVVAMLVAVVAMLVAVVAMLVATVPSVVPTLVSLVPPDPSVPVAPRASKLVSTCCW